MQFNDERGYLIVAVNRGDVDYVPCAEACAKSIRQHTPGAKIAVYGNKNIQAEASDVFDYKIPVAFPMGDNKYEADWHAGSITPFRETIKIEADMIIPHSIEHWWTMFEKRDVVLTIGSRSYRNEATPVRYYRKLFDDNNLPDVYNAITYWRFSQTSVDFFNLVKYLFVNWETVSKQIKYGFKDPGSTDIIYAIAAKLYGIEKLTLPGTSYPSLIHMKGHINGLRSEDWRDELTWELDGSNIRINTIDQQYPFHYVQKDFAEILNEHFDTC